ncbi:P2X purinoceptor 7 isoform X1 [Podarcis raffonei]|uniref:P2X purinoceptor 7 isoform X1 n=1 Tax=Podarcis raffonei TaxID=65483 RepID=UPI0023294009|nr:P2X purinoceptor 7 isoform X1 [Podarcis raffonei]
MAGCCSLKNVCEYETNKVVRIQSVYYGSLKWAIHSVVFMYVCVVLIADRRYQKKDSVISSVHTKVKGVSQTEARIWDTVEYTLPIQGINSFFVLTNIIKTENQVQGLCPEFPLAKAVCSTDKSCMKGRMDPQINGIQTGKCVNYNTTIKTCEVAAWCPVESIKKAPEPAILRSAENFTVLIKNNIHFPKFNYTKRNISPDFNISCTYNKNTAPHCPIFRLGDILRASGENFSEVAVQGGIVGIEINWDCNLDKWLHRCEPKYGFRRLDDKKTNEALYPGNNFRFAKYYKQAGGKEERTLIKAYGIRFDILVFGMAGRFDFFELLVYIGSALSYFGLAQFVVDFLITSYSCRCFKYNPVKEYYIKKKCEMVPGPRWTLLYVTFVDEPHIFMIDKFLRTSLQKVKGEVIHRNTGDFMRAAKLQLQHPDEVVSLLGDSEEVHPLQSQGGPASSSSSSSCERPAWCCCGKCRPAKGYWEQLCCRRKNGACITTSDLFERLVLSRPMLKFVLLYKEPLLDLNGEASDRKFRHCAYKQYIHWRFGEEDLEERALIPNCCRWKIRDAFPSENGQYAGFVKKA